MIPATKKTGFIAGIVAIIAGIIATIWYVVGFVIQDTDNQLPDDNEILFQKEETWGPCADGEVCRQKILVYQSGRVIFHGNTNKEFTLGPDAIDLANFAITDSNVMEKNCDAPRVEDYQATTTLQTYDEKRTFTYPECEDELDAIEEVLRLRE